MVYQSSEEDEQPGLCDILNEVSQSQRTKRPCLAEFLKEFEENMKHFNQNYTQSKSQFLTDMKSFNHAELNKEDEIIERSIKDSNYFPESNTPSVFPGKEVNKDKPMADKAANSPDIEGSQDASNFKSKSPNIFDGQKGPSDLRISN